ncbi:nucleoside deaminase [Cystobacter fuscus]|uniref:nucleoside deaminase n=1 Tax=Cystobacter fuscus TaxID=43 RepID=UPI002B2F0856|nr:nucleoside deaminase [Cystobacter fuscus]
MRPEDKPHLMHAIDLARRARARGNHPFGSVLVDARGRVLLEGENTQGTTGDCTGHAESNLMGEATRRYRPEELADSTLYASTEPCAMCAGAIFWGGVRRVVFALSSEDLSQFLDSSAPTLRMSCRDVFARGSSPTEVVGPVALPEAHEVHEGFWKS